MADRETMDYYQANAVFYGHVEPNPDGNFVAYRNQFIEALEPQSSVLDLGCGGGHAALAFLQHGFEVVALDGSKALAEIAAKRIGGEVVVKDFSALDYEARFDGIWAAASLTHVPLSQLDAVFALIRKAIRVEGLLVASFKLAETDWRDDYGRYYSAMNSHVLGQFAERAGFTVNRIDVLPGRGRDYEDATWAWLVAQPASL